MATLLQLARFSFHPISLFRTQLIYPKSDEQRRRLGEAVKNILLFRSLDQVIHTRINVATINDARSEALMASSRTPSLSRLTSRAHRLRKETSRALETHTTAACWPTGAWALRVWRVLGLASSNASRSQFAALSCFSFRRLILVSLFLSSPCLIRGNWCLDSFPHCLPRISLWLPINANDAHTPLLRLDATNRSAATQLVIPCNFASRLARRAAAGDVRSARRDVRAESRSRRFSHKARR